ncbi:UDP-N-acetylmuramoyl-L-alanyl-D-glutamate--2,6-diaminopimelate ligase [Lysobacter pythonis]|uniref:UDP-N-acetylmuramoyl-L-alanyl-D-glutamate--2,6-diaminopimelate ligase n=1 Tax=Solilutibacter pythonis TaxID=2483112 RepID=A0A3M2I3L3_9GAMM|nr:UDP-N-acetylmuramoyl-L-alanyl-D-glutamate--2,6-diaminopimelate ligase [Lysobacter pythonis]RMH94199.1 UDP-N-acetylmuramoyl-L-alanyl-D-glutamate--2,6-diaminopimelate ligase [Lysobacter pythonis]
MSRAMPLAELLPEVAGIPAALEIHGLAMDSREVRPGDAFAALLPARQETPASHGLNFVAQARAAGAVAVLYDPADGVAAPADAIAVPGLRERLAALAGQFHGHPSRAMTLIGVTGTSGKTSTVQLLAQALSHAGIRTGTIGTLGAGLFGEEVATGFTTPLVLRTHALLAELRDAGAGAVAMEVSSHALDQGRVEGVEYDIAVFTNLTRDHLDYHGDMRHYGEAKARLFRWPGLRAAVINRDDAFGAGLLAELPPSVRGIGISASGDAAADIAASNVALDARGIGFDLRIGDRAARVRSPLLGRFNIDNLLSVAGVLLARGAGFGEIVAALEALRPVAGRMNRLGGDGRLPLVVVDYSHKPDPLEQALHSLRAHLKGGLTCVFGCGGERDRGKRPQMAAIAEANAEHVIVTDDNPRGEDGDAIVAGIVAGFAHPERATVLRDRREAIERAIRAAGADDIVLIAGKGHETYQEVRGVKHPFDDLAVAKAVLEACA